MAHKVTYAALNQQRCTEHARRPICLEQALDLVFVLVFVLGTYNRVADAAQGRSKQSPVVLAAIAAETQGSLHYMHCTADTFSALSTTACFHSPPELLAIQELLPTLLFLQLASQKAAHPAVVPT